MILRGPPAPPARHPTLVHALAAAAAHPSGATFVELSERETFLPWGEVHARAARVAAGLVALGVAPGDRVAIILRTEPAFLDAFFGCWLAGAVPVPLYPPVRLGRMDEYAAATGRMIAVSGARLVLSRGGVRRLLGGAVLNGLPALGCRDVEEVLAAGARAALPAGGAGADPRAPSPDALGLVQFSSGSTREPKAVALTHRALAAQADVLLAATAPGPADVMVSWLPLYHDMGLIGAVLGAMSYPGPLVLLAPEHFLARPALWLRAIARHGGTISAAPSFAYAYAADRVRDAELEGVSLASWRLALDGAEPVSPEAMRRFAARFARRGLDARALVPVYGLAEATLAVTFRSPGRPLEGLSLDPVRLARDGVVAPGRREVVPVGVPLPGVEVEVRDGAGAPLGPGRLGRIVVRSPSLMREYLGDAAASARALGADGWLDTGDLGFVAGGELHVHGRAKDVVVVRGANHAPEEFEAPLAAVRGLRAGCAVAAGFVPEGGDGEALLVLAEHARGAERSGALEEAVRRAVLDRTGIAPHTVHLLAPGTLPRTSSGKLRRGEAVRRFLAGTLAPPRRTTALRLALEAARSGVAFARARRRSPP